MRVLLHAARLATVLMAATPVAAPAQSNDPAQGSPSGKVYEIPLDDARRDAAPSGGGNGSEGDAAQPIQTQGSSGSATGANPSPIRSENNFGSSSTVPGASPAGRGTDRDDDSAEGTAGGGSSDGGTGGTPAASPQGDAAGRVIGAPGSGAVAPSKSRAYLLLLLALGAAVGLAAAGRYLSRGR